MIGLNKIYVACLVVVLGILVTVPTLAASQIKFAIVAPEGSTWTKVVDAWNAELKAKTKGSVSLKVYAGGVQGDETDVIRKMRIGQIDAAGLTGKGLGMINSEVRILELPFMFRNYAEVDAVKGAIRGSLEEGFKKKGFVLLGWAEAGFVNIFSNKPIAKLNDLKGVKMWMWESDPLVKSMCEALDVVPIPLALTDVLTSLQTNLIDAAYAPPLGAIALQWFTRTKYYTSDKLSNSTGALVISKRALSKLSPSEQKVLRETAKKYSRILVERTRAENEQSYAALKKAGLSRVQLDENDRSEIYAKSEQVWNNLAGKLYSPALLAQVRKTLKSVRGN